MCKQQHWVLVALLGMLLGIPAAAHAQAWPARVHGMFGDREIGSPLKPGRRTMSGTSMTDSSGRFLGRMQDDALQFPNMFWQRPAPGPKWPGWSSELAAPSEPVPAQGRPLPVQSYQREAPPKPVLGLRPQPPPAPSRPAPIPAQASPPLPDQWLRVPANRSTR